jgi:hypothetical protein
MFFSYALSMNQRSRLERNLEEMLMMKLIVALGV